MRIKLTAAALLLTASLAAAGCSNHNNDANPSSSAATAPEASASSSATASTAATATGSASAAPSGEAPSSPAAGEGQSQYGILISLPSGNEYKSFMKISDADAAKVIKLLDGADWEKKDSIAMAASPTCKLAKLAGEQQKDTYYVWTGDPAAYELVKDTGGSAYAKLSKKDSAALAKLLPLP